MAINKNEKEAIQNTGFSSDSKSPSQRFINENGALNVNFAGRRKWQQFSIYHQLLNITHIRFLLIIFAFYTVFNFIFAILYMLIGVNHLSGVIANSTLEEFSEAYFFSSQTLTTLGYGRISPVGFAANVLSAIESFMGVITFAIITGLLYGRFTKPKAFIQFSKVAVVAPFQEITGLMFRLAPTKNSTISSLRASVTMSMNIKTDGVIKNTFFTLPLQLSTIMSLALSWTIVHPIDKESPLYGLSKKDIDEANVHLLVFIEGFDEGFSNTVVSRTEYLYNDINPGFKFIPMFKYSEKLNQNELHLNMIDQIMKI